MQLSDRVEIVRKALEKVRENNPDYLVGNYTPRTVGPLHDVKIEGTNFSFMIGQGHTFFGNIFDHDFAKALWGEYGTIPEARYPLRYKKSNGVERTKILIVASHVSAWQYHLQQMVIDKDPHKYLGANL